MELTKNIYLARKKMNETDGNIAKEFRIGVKKLGILKKGWGVSIRKRAPSPPTKVAEQPPASETDYLKLKEEHRRQSDQYKDLVEELRISRAELANEARENQRLQMDIEAERQRISRLPELEAEIRLLKSLLKFYL
jgi:hypothetical protein